MKTIRIVAVDSSFVDLSEELSEIVWAYAKAYGKSPTQVIEEVFKEFIKMKESNESHG